SVDTNVIGDDLEAVLIDQRAQVTLAEWRFERLILFHKTAQLNFQGGLFLWLLAFHNEEHTADFEHRRKIAEDALLIFEVMQRVVTDNRVEFFRQRRGFNV